jgi:hypothetical protein
MSTPIAQLAREHARLLDGSRAAMTIAGADLTSGFFAGVAWHNLRFVDCDFAGEGNVRLDAMSDCRFMDCRFIAPSHDFGVMDDVRFVRCRTSGAAILGGRDASFGVVFEECVFAGAATRSRMRAKASAAPAKRLFAAARAVGPFSWPARGSRSRVAASST